MANSTLDDAFNIFDLRDKAKSRLPKWLFEFVDRGTEDEVALRNNRSAFERIKLKTHILNDVSKRTQKVTLFGKQHDMPIAIAPTGSAGMMWYQGELELARAAKAAGIPFSLSTGSITSMEKIASDVGGTLWFQLYMWADRNLSLQLVNRARAAGYEGLIVTVDGVVAGNREYNQRNGFSVPFSYNRRNSIDVMTHPRWLLGVLARYLLTTGMPKRENYPEELKQKITSGWKNQAAARNDSLSWDDLKALRAAWPGKLMVKGILNARDAVMAADHGADGVIVSNHGARNLDSTPAPIDVLPRVVDAVGKRATVIVDSGFRRGSDVVKALALGAKMVLIGRGTLYGTAVAGQAGAARAIDIYREEIDRVMALIGCTGVAELGPKYLNDAADDEAATGQS